MQRATMPNATSRAWRKNMLKAYLIQPWFLLTCAAIGAAPAAAQTYPSKPVRYIVPFPAGASPDIVARAITSKLSRMWGQQVLVDNRSGGTGTFGAQVAAKAPADGHTIFQCNIASSAIAESLFSKLGYDHARDFAPITLIGTTANALVVHPSLPKTLKEFVAYARSQPDKMSYGSSGVGSSPHLAMELLKMMTKISIVHVPYQSAPQAVSEVMAGQIEAAVTNVPQLLPLIQGNRVRALAVTSAKRVEQIPAVPTMAEGGLPGYEVYSWYGVCTNAGTPAPILDKMNTDVTEVLRSPDIQKTFGELMIDITPTTRDGFAKFMRDETARWAEVAKAAGITKQ
jgi:tripartite-type tricarboxylate transporter receptor subunit TctC